VITNGNNSPTPVTVVDAQDLLASNPGTIGDAMNSLPVFSGSNGQISNPNPGIGSGGGGNGARNSLNLRNLGEARTLVLLDGHRVPSTTSTNVVDDGIDRSGNQPVDASLAVLKFETLSGEPIAFVLNYGIEPVVAMASPTEISGDVPGATSRYIEDEFADKAVAIFTIGPAASPLYRVRPDPQSGTADVDRAHEIVGAMGTILGEEALAAAKDSKLTSTLRIAAAKRVLQCPGKNTTPFNLRTQCAYTPDSKLPACEFKDTDSDPVSLSMWLLKIGDVALVQADANVTSELGEKLRRASPVSNTLIVALNFGPARFVVDEASYPLNTYEATASGFKRGCAEQGFLGNALQMIDQLH
jgi:hypothetical protein